MEERDQELTGLPEEDSPPPEEAAGFHEADEDLEDAEDASGDGQRQLAKVEFSLSEEEIFTAQNLMMRHDGTTARRGLQAAVLIFFGVDFIRTAITGDQMRVIIGILGVVMFVVAATALFYPRKSARRFAKATAGDFQAVITEESIEITGEEFSSSMMFYRVTAIESDWMLGFSAPRGQMLFLPLRALNETQKEEIHQMIIKNKDIKYKVV